MNNIPLHELKYYHNDKKGFVFRGATPVSDDSATQLARNMITWTAADSMPEMFRIDSNIVAFAYPHEERFEQALLYQASRRFLMMGFFELDTLAAWLKEH